MPELRVISSNPRGGGTRGRLLQAAMSLLETVGYGRVSVAAVAERAGVTPAAFHEHFATKAELFAEIVCVMGDRERAAVNAAAAGSRSAAEEIELVVATFAGRALTRPRLAAALVYEPVEPLVEEARLAYRREYTQRLAEFVRERVDAGELPDQDPDLTAAALIGVILESLVGPLAPAAGGNADPDAIVASLTALCQRAIGAPPS